MDQSQPRDIDVLCGRGGLANRHVGNQLFLRVVSHNKKLYNEIQDAKRKQCLALSIIGAVESAGARFLRQDKATGQWTEITRSAAISKTLQALREKTSSAKPQSPPELSKQDDTTSSTVVRRQRKQQPKKNIPKTNQTSRESLHPEVVHILTTSALGGHASDVKRSVTPELQVGPPCLVDEDDSTAAAVTSSDEYSMTSDDACTPYQVAQYDQLDLFDGDEWENIETLLSPLF